MLWPDQNNKDRKLWDALRNGSVEALDQIYYNNVQILFNYGDKITGNKVLVEDAVQEIFIEIWQKKEKLGATDSIRYYLIKSLRRRLYKKIKKEGKYLKPAQNQNHDEAIFHSFDLEPPFTRGLDEDESFEYQSRELNRVIQTLAPRQKEAVFLKFYDNLSFKEVAGVMDLSIKYTYKLISETLDKMKNNMEKNKYLYLFLFIFIFI